MSVPSESASKQSTSPSNERVFRLRPSRHRFGFWFVGTIGAVLLIVGLLLWTVLFVPHEGPGPYLLASFFTFFGVLLVAVALGHRDAGPRSAVTVTPDSIAIDNGLWRPRTYSFSEIRGILHGSEGEVFIARKFGYYHHEDMRDYVERDDLEEFEVLIRSYAKTN